MLWPVLCVVAFVAASNSSDAVEPMQPIDKSALRPNMEEKSHAQPSLEVAVVGATVVLCSAFGLLVAAFVQRRRRRDDLPV